MANHVNEVPANLYAYFRALPEQFESRTNVTKKIIYSALLIFGLVLLIKPDLVYSEFSLLLRIIGGALAVIFGLCVFVGGSDYYSKKSNGKISAVCWRKIDVEEISESTILSLLATRDFKALSLTPTVENGPLQLSVCHDSKGKTYYIQLNKYFSSSDFRGITEVFIVEGEEYEKNKNFLRALV